LDLRGLTLLTDCFVICSGASERQLRALASTVREEVKKAEEILPLSVEGDASSGWILMDYGGVVVHIFAPELRVFYDLEDLWREGKVLLRVK